MEEERVAVAELPSSSAAAAVTVEVTVQKNLSLLQGPRLRQLEPMGQHLGSPLPLM